MNRIESPILSHSDPNSVFSGPPFCEIGFVLVCWLFFRIARFLGIPSRN